MTTGDATILITGHTGFMGKAVTAHFDRLGLGWSGVSSRTGISLDREEALGALPRADVIVHLAGRVGVVDSWSSPYETHRINYLSTLTVMEHARRHHARVVLMSSYVYGPPQTLPVNENQPTSAVNPYGWSKLECEMVARAFAADFGVPVTILRLFGVYGPGQDESHLLPSLCRQALDGNTISLADPRPKRDLLWVDDVATAIGACATAPMDPGCEVYNLGAGLSHSVAEIVDIMLELTGPRDVQWRHDYRKNEILDCVADNTKIKKKYGWEPKTDLQTGMRILLNKMSSQ
jgi:nucleoside-diphosphate-sugar epimerase